MKKKGYLLALSLVLISLVSVFIYKYRLFFKQNPIKNNIQFENISYINQDQKNNTYLIDKSKKRIIKINDAGIIQYSMPQNVIKSEIFNQFSEITADENGFIYVLNTLLDENGLNVKEEQITKYTPKGKFYKTLNKFEYKKNSKIYRVGHLKKLKVVDNFLYFFNVDKNVIELYRMDLEGDELKKIRQIKLSEETYVHDIVQAENGDIFYLTKKGLIYKLDKQDHSELIYSRLNYGKALPVRTLPKCIDIDSQNNLYFVDYYSQGISKLKINKYKTMPEHLLYSDDLFKEYYNNDFNESLNIFIKNNGKIIASSGKDINFINSKGKVEKTLEGTKYSKKDYALRWVFWIAVIILILLIVDTIRVIYVKFMNRKMSLILKEILIFTPVVIILSVSLSKIIEDRDNKTMQLEMFQKLNSTVKIACNSIEGDKLSNIKNSEDFLNDDYNSVVRATESAYKINKEIVYNTGNNELKNLFEGNKQNKDDGVYNTIYRWDKKENQLYLIKDDDDSKLSCKPFMPFEYIIKSVICEGKIIDSIEDDGDSQWLFVSAPIYNSQKEVVGIYEAGVDYNYFIENNYKTNIHNIINIAVEACIIIAAFLFMSKYLLSSIGELKKGVSEVACGKWDTEVAINSNDEIADLGDGFNKMSQYIREFVDQITLMNEAYFCFVPQQFLALLGKTDMHEIELGDNMKKEMSTLYSNIRSFYAIAENLTPEENFEFINSYLKRFGPVIRNYEGIIDKYLGVDILALFPNEPKDALDAAIEMTRELSKYNQLRIMQGQKIMEIGIGIYYGPLMLGIIGEEKRLEGTVISDSGNIAEVLGKLCEKLSASILITENTLKTINEYNNYKYRTLGCIIFEGNLEPIQVLDVYQSESEHMIRLKDSTKKLFEEGIRLYREGRFYDARQKFVRVIKQNKFDKVAKIYFYLCEEYYKNGTPKGWNGSLELNKI